MRPLSASAAEPGRRPPSTLWPMKPNGLSEDDAMLAGHAAAIERLRADPVEWAAWQAEIAELDGTLGDGLSEL